MCLSVAGELVFARMALFTQDSTSDLTGGVQVDFLLPTGILVPIDCKGTQTMEEIKDTLWTQAKQLPLFDRVRRPEWYTLVFVNRQAEQEECWDESQRLCDIRWYKPLFKLVEKKGDSDEKVFASKIGWLTGKCLRDFEAVDDPAVDDFRMSMLEKCKLAIEARNAGSFEEKVLYCYPPDIENTEEVTPLVQERLNPKVGDRWSQNQTLEKSKRMVWHIDWSGSVHCARYEGALPIGF